MDAANSKPLILVGVALLAFGLSWFITPRLRDFAIRRGLLDMPEARRVHQKPTPRLGGLAMLTSFVLAVLAALITGLLIPGFWNYEDLWRIGLLLLGGTLLSVVMVVDDLRGLNPLSKLLWQFLAAAIVIVPQLISNDPHHPIGVIIDSVAGLRIADNPWSLWLVAVPFTFFWIMGMINTVNLSDGVDGLAGGIVFVGALILFLETVFQAVFQKRGDGSFQFTSSFLSLALAAAIGGFLIFNWHPASIFMGDCGAYFLGYALAVISIIDGAKLAIALLIIGFPVLDEAFVYLNRIYHGRPPHKADRTHFHHRLLDMGWTVPRIVSLFYALSLGFGIIGVLPFMQGWLQKLLGLIALAACLVPLLIYSVRFKPRQPAPLSVEPAPPEEMKPVSKVDPTKNAIKSIRTAPEGRPNRSEEGHLKDDSF